MMQYATPVYGPPIMQYGPPPKKKTKKRVAVVAAVAAAGLASAGVYATTLGVTASQDAAGTSDAVASCDASVNTTTGDPEWNATTDEYEFTQVTVSTIDEDCIGQTVYVQPVDSEGNAVGSGGSAPIAATSQDVTVGAASLKDFDKMTVVIHEG